MLGDGLLSSLSIQLERDLPSWSAARSTAAFNDGLILTFNSIDLVSTGAIDSTLLWVHCVPYPYFGTKPEVPTCSTCQSDIVYPVQTVV